MLGDLDSKNFFSKHWNKSPYLVRGSAGRFEALYSATRFWELAHLSEVDAARRDARGQQDQFEISVAEIKDQFEAGSTICASVLTDPDVNAFAQTLSDRLAIPASGSIAKIYASPDQAGFSLHSDAHHVFVLQLEGQKRWSYSETPFSESTLFGSKLSQEGTPVYTGERSGQPIVDSKGEPLLPPTDLTEVVLSPGDCLYLPPGCWHQARALGESVGLSVSPARNPGIDVLCRLFRSILKDRPQFRQDVIAEPHDSGRPAFEVESLFVEFQKVVGQLRGNQLANAWAGVAALERGSTQVPEDDAAAAPEPHQRLSRTDPNPMLYVVNPKDQVIICHAGNSAFALPLAAIDFVTRLATSETFLAEEVMEWDPALTWPDAQRTLYGLLQSGVLKVQAD